MLPSVLMIHLLILAVHLLATIAKLMRPGGVRAVVAESLMLKHQLLISCRARRRAPNREFPRSLFPGSWITVGSSQDCSHRSAFARVYEFAVDTLSISNWTWTILPTAEAY